MLTTVTDWSFQEFFGAAGHTQQFWDLLKKQNLWYNDLHAKYLVWSVDHNPPPAVQKVDSVVRRCG